jgi:hypothetical protein
LAREERSDALTRGDGDDVERQIELAGEVRGLIPAPAAVLR